LMLTSSLYSSLPACLQTLACSAEGLRLKHIRYGAGFQRMLSEWELRSTWSDEKFAFFRDRRIADFMQDTVARVPFYRKRFKELGVDPRDLRTLDSIGELPILTREEFKAHRHDFTPEGMRLGRCNTISTSGTSGSGLKLCRTAVAEREQWAVWWRYRRWHGIDTSTWCAMFGGRLIKSPGSDRPPFWRINYPGRQVLFSSHHLSPANVSLYLEELRRRQVPWVHGHPSTISLLSKYILEYSFDLGYQIRWVTTGAEALSADQASLIKSAFGIQPRQHYGMAEAVANFSECDRGRMHVDEDFAAVEFVPADSVGLDNCYRVVGTNFTNLATPLVRYDVNDLVILGRGSCPCGRPGRIVESVHGRTEDFVVLQDGKRFGPVNQLFKHIEAIREAQIRQDSPGHLIINIVRGSNYSNSDEAHLLREVGQRLGPGNFVEVRYVPKIERNPSGKLQVVVANAISSEQAKPLPPRVPGALAQYAKLPSAMQDIACSIEGCRIMHTRYGRGYAKISREVETRGTWDGPTVAKFRDERLQSFLRAAITQTPFYRGSFSARKIPSDGTDTSIDLELLPVLTKRDIQGREDEFESLAMNRHLRTAVHTSGTTGAGLSFATTLQAAQEQWAIWWRYRQWHGIRLNTWCGYFGGRSVVSPRDLRPPFWRTNWPGRQVLFSAYHVSPGNLPAYVDELRRRRLPWLHGYPSILTLVASYLLDSGRDLGYKPRWVTTGAENLLPRQAVVLERAFGTRPRQHYGMAEAVANFSECELGRLHIDEDFAYVELLPTSQDNSYRILGCNFTNAAFPLIRYDTGDLATLSDGYCSCGRPGRLISAVDGRQEDYVVLRDGSKIGRMDHIFKGLERIVEAQIYQRRPEEIIYRIVKGRGYSDKDEQELLRETSLRVGDRTRVRVEYVDAVERTSSGKLRFVVSELDNGKLDSSLAS